MAEDYTESAQTALELIKESGSPGFFIRNEGSLNDNSQPWEGEMDNPVSYPANIVLLPMSSSDKSLMSDSIADKTISSAFMDAVEFTEIPEIGDSISHDGIKWQIETIEALKPATVNVFWQLVVSR